MIAEIGWVQALAFASCFVAVVVGLTSLAHAWLSNRHERQKMKMEHGHEMTKEVNEFD